MSQPNGYQKIEVCWSCGNECLYTYKTFGNCWETNACEICVKHWGIKRYTNQFYLDIRNLVRKYGDRWSWITEDDGDLERIKERVERTMGWACKELGTELATLILNKAIKDYWNEVKGHWVYSSRSEVSYLPQPTLRRQREDRVGPL